MGAMGDNASPGSHPVRPGRYLNDGRFRGAPGRSERGLA